MWSLALAAASAAPEAPRVWPIPHKLEAPRGGTPSSLSKAFEYKHAEPADKIALAAQQRYAPILRNASITDGKVQIIQITVQNSSLALGIETDYSYSLSLSPGADTVQLVASSAFGVAHGLETLAQLYSQPASFSGFTVVDRPSYPFRAVMVDCGRRFVPLSTLFELLDGMAYAKMNVLNLHASEYGFFRIAIKAFPELTQGLDPTQFYKQEDVKALVEYAQLRGIRVIPQVSEWARTAPTCPDLYGF